MKSRSEGFDLRGKIKKKVPAEGLSSQASGGKEKCREGGVNMVEKYRSRGLDGQSCLKKKAERRVNLNRNIKEVWDNGGEAGKKTVWEGQRRSVTDYLYRLRRKPWGW